MLFRSWEKAKCLSPVQVNLANETSPPSIIAGALRARLCQHSAFTNAISDAFSSKEHPQNVHNAGKEESFLFLNGHIHLFLLFVFRMKCSHDELFVEEIA